MILRGRTIKFEKIRGVWYLSITRESAEETDCMWIRIWGKVANG